MRGWQAKLGLGGIALAILAAGIVVYSRSDRDHAAPAAVAPEPIPVIAATVQQQNVPIVLTGLGTVTALNTATIGSQVSGLLISVNFKEGQLVKKGELLAQIDPRTYQAQVDQAEATLSHDQAHLKNAELNLERYQGLAKENSIAREQSYGFWSTEQAITNENSGHYETYSAQADKQFGWWAVGVGACAELRVRWQRLRNFLGLRPGNVIGST